MVIEGYTELVKIAENGLNGKKDKVKAYMELFISNYPKHDFVKPFKSILAGETNHFSLWLDGEQKQ